MRDLALLLIPQLHLLLENNFEYQTIRDLSVVESHPSAHRLPLYDEEHEDSQEDDMDEASAGSSASQARREAKRGKKRHSYWCISVWTRILIRVQGCCACEACWLARHGYLRAGEAIDFRSEHAGFLTGFIEADYMRREYKTNSVWALMMSALSPDH